MSLCWWHLWVFVEWQVFLEFPNPGMSQHFLSCWTRKEARVIPPMLNSSKISPTFHKIWPYISRGFGCIPRSHYWFHEMWSEVLGEIFWGGVRFSQRLCEIWLRQVAAYLFFARRGEIHWKPNVLKAWESHQRAWLCAQMSSYRTPCFFLLSLPTFFYHHQFSMNKMPQYPLFLNSVLCCYPHFT